MTADEGNAAFRAYKGQWSCFTLWRKLTDQRRGEGGVGCGGGDCSLLEGACGIIYGGVACRGGSVFLYVSDMI